MSSTSIVFFVSVTRAQGASREAAATLRPQNVREGMNDC